MDDEGIAQSEAGADDSAGGTGMKRLVTLSLPSTDRLLAMIGGAAMVLSALFSWSKWEGLDTFPNLAGAGASSYGAGLMILLLGVSFLLGRPSMGVAIGRSLGAVLIALVFILRDLDGRLAAGAWLALIASAVVLVGVLLSMTDSANRGSQRVTCAGAAGLGAVLAVVGSFWLDWNVYGLSGPGDLQGGLSGQVIVGIPVLILGAAALVMLLGIAGTTASAGAKSAAALVVQVAAVCIGLLAATDVLAALVGFSAFPMGSGPLVALVGSIIMARSVGAATAD